MTSRTYNATCIVLTGPPAAGKTTIRMLFENVGAESIELVQEYTDLKSTLRIQLSLAEENDSVLVIEGLDNTPEINWLSQQVEDRVLIVRVDTTDRSIRKERYISRELPSVVGDMDVIETDLIGQLEEELEQVERDNRPYPDEHLTFVNDDDESGLEKMLRCERILELIE